MDDIQIKQLARLIDTFSKSDGIHKTAVPKLNLIKLSDVNMRLPTVYEPSLCVIVQGKKQVLLNNEIYRYTPSQYLVVSVDMPVIGQVTQASAKEPYLCLQVDIDQRQLGELMAETQQAVAAKPQTDRALFVGKVDASLSDCILRLARLLETSQDIPMLAPMITREIYYRLLSGAYGATMAQIVSKGSNMQRINSVIQRIKSKYNEPISIDDMADIAGMSVSSFHFHFKEVTAMSPLQYQKNMRLMEARRIMFTDSTDAASTAYLVGYESPSQFSREYARMFGLPPVRDMNLARELGGT